MITAIFKYRFYPERAAPHDPGISGFYLHHSLQRAQGQRMQEPVEGGRLAPGDTGGGAKPGEQPGQARRR